MATSPVRAPLIRRKQEQKYFIVMALVAAVVVFYGFSRSYFLKGLFGTPPLPSIVHLHGVIFTSWIALFVAQTTLVSAGRTDIHRRLGIIGVVLAAVMLIVGPVTAINAARLGRTPPGPPSLVFLAVPLFDMVLFAMIITAGFYFRRKPDYHKRLMLAATIAILPAPFARFTFFDLQSHMPTAAFLLMDVVLLSAIAYDTLKQRRLHPAFAWSALLVLISFPIRMMIAGTATWMQFAAWLTR